MQFKWIHTLPGYEDVLTNTYRIYEDGTLISYRSFCSNSQGIIRYTSDQPQRRLKTHLDNKGYERIALCTKNGKNKKARIHRLVALAFLSNPLHKPQVNHKDGIKTNNHVGNLEWVTNTENHSHKLRMGLNVSLSGKNHYTRVKKEYTHNHPNSIKVEQLDKNGTVIQRFCSMTEACKQLNLHNSSLSIAVQTGNFYRGYKWRKIPTL